MDINEEKISAAVTDQVASELMSSHDLNGLVRQEVSKRIDAIFAERAEAQISDAIDAAIKDGFNRTYQRVDSFGKQKGEQTSISKELEKLVSEYWSKRVDTKSGKPTDSDFSSVSRAEYLMTKICADDFFKTVQQSAQNVTGHIKDGLRGQIAKQMDAMLDGLFKVKSLQDQGKVEKPY